jgi:hypothetical protein
MLAAVLCSGLIVSMFFLHGISIENGQQGISYNVLTLGDGWLPQN